MKYLIILSITILSFCSCEQEIHCDYADYNVAPCGFSLQKIATIPTSKTHLRFQMIDKNIGYAHSFGGSEVDLFKTEDGGKTWNNWSISISINNNPFTMLFVDENQGYIAQRGDTLQASMMITSDGGLTWTKKDYPDYEFFTFLLKDQDGNIYSCTREGHFIKSTDKGLSWENIISVYPSSYVASIFDDQIYFSGIGHDIFVFDLDGNIVKKITGEVTNGIEQMKIIDSMNIVISSNHSTIKTSDGGENWSNIYDQEANIIDFPTSEIGLMVMNDGYCDIHQTTVIGLTNDGGQTWMKSEEMNNFKSGYTSARKVGENHYLLLVEADIYELKK